MTTLRRTGPGRFTTADGTFLTEFSAPDGWPGWGVCWLDEQGGEHHTGYVEENLEDARARITTLRARSLRCDECGARRPADRRTE